MIAVPFLQLIVAMVLGTRSQNYPTDRKPPLWELAPYVVLVRFAVAFAKVWLMAVAKPPIDPIAAKERSTDRKSTRLNSSHLVISYAVFCLKKKKMIQKFARSIAH